MDSNPLPKTFVQEHYINEMNGFGDVKGGKIEGTGEGGKVEIPYGTQIDKVGNKKTLKPNAKYTTPEGYTYETNEFGRIDSVEADLQLGKGTRNKYAQSNVGETDRIRGDYPERDDGGHLIGRQFKGSGDIDNLVPMNSQINEAGGKWHQMEQEWASALERKENVKVKITPQYTSNAARPDSFTVEYSIDGGRTKKLQ
ncbi:DNA/RNA non-specific endonuclease [Paenibacillus sp. FSL E2-8871]|uniref:DNA/RNA non-specific endonuclease n=1 Tax=Paenibacillus sp. FSL E2-8871 TaxID=2975326 RepID=UPI0030F4D07D